MENEEFEKIYKKLVEKDEKIIQKIRMSAMKQSKSVNKKLVVSGIICLIIFIIYIIYKSSIMEINLAFVLSKFVSCLLIYFFIGSLILMIPKSNSELNKYRNEYREIVIKDFIKLFNNNLDYNQNKSISRDVYYKEAEFNYEGGQYSSSSLIQNNVNNRCNIYISRVSIDDVQRGDNSVTSFLGLFSKIEMPIKCNSNIYLRIDKNEEKVLDKISHIMFVDGIRINKLKNIRIKLDSQELEEKFDLYATNEEDAIKFMDNDMIQKLISFYNKFNYEFTIKDNCIYIRIFTGYNIFEPPQWSSTYSLDKQKLYETYKILYNIFSLIDVLVNEVNEINS